MRSNPMDVDPRIREALKDVTPAAGAHVDWTALHRAIVVEAGGELARRRNLGRRWAGGAAMAVVAAGVAFLLLGPAQRAWREDASRADVVSRSSAVDDLLDGSQTDDELRALLAGADEADTLLLIAADDGRADRGEP